MTLALLTMSHGEINRAEWMLRIQERRATQAQVAEHLGVSLRQVERMYRAYKAGGAGALVSKKRGRPSARRLPEALRANVVRLVREKYSDFGPTLAREKLAEVHGGRAPRCVLLVYVDDATSRLMQLRFVESESAFDYFAATRSYLEKHGRPVAFYSDKHSVFRPTAKQPRAGAGTTQFARAMSELNIDVLCANSPQAKGRVERAHLTMQDRLVKEMRLRGIDSMAVGNAFLPEFAADYNVRFAQAAASPHDAHRPLRSDDDLEQIFRWKEQRKLTANLTIHYERQSSCGVLRSNRRSRETEASSARSKTDDVWEIASAAPRGSGTITQSGYVPRMRLQTRQNVAS